ncbi:hypothetical protein B9Z55_015700 [Caenorhabditis nigoni]|uniref:Uncharacterized protein n=1 Tax=Caenorhabditis nigoni TaxID=1611254 RepID=A0A2G5UBH7_9PELO|nr:hypothetical protein B9Z55_015700 [Caenorhabditis nigoni]
MELFASQLTNCAPFLIIFTGSSLSTRVVVCEGNRRLMAILRKKKQILNEEEFFIQCQVAEISEDHFNNLFDAAMTLKPSKQWSDEGECGN